MRPEKAYKIISDTIRQYYVEENRKVVYSKEFMTALDKMIKKVKIDINKSNNSGLWGDTVWEYDTRDPYELYGFEDQESIDNNMCYISDRFICDFRLNWLKCGVENNEF